MKKAVSIVVCIALIAGVFGVSSLTGREYAEAKSEVRGLWIGFCDFKDLGLYHKNKDTFTKNIRKVLKDAKYYGTNAVYFHVRAFDDATWNSKTFKMSKDINPVGEYDPLKIVVKEAKAQKMQIHAWMNPYRITYDRFLDPAKDSSTKRILTAIDEVLDYDVDGIHFDDYFYHAKKEYYDRSTKKSIKASKKPSASDRRANCNKMIKKAYKASHDGGAIFGISPAGNVENCMSGGADVKKWMNKDSKDKYVDYIAPQIYWTDNWGSSGKTKMYSDRLAQWKKLNTKKVPMYIGLALYRTGQKASDDKGWAKRTSNIRTQVKQLRSNGMAGYILFSSADLNDSHAKSELYKLKGLVKPIYPTSIKFSKKTRTVYLKTKPTYTVKFAPSSTNPKSVAYKSSNKKIAKVNSSGKITPIKKGTVTITATAKKGKVAKMKITVKKFKKFKAKTTKKTTVRYKASSSSKKITTLKKGKTVTIKKLSSNGKWGMYKKNRWIYLPHTNKG